MFLCVEKYVIGIVIAVVAVQYAFALFCLLKLAYLDITKREYVLWNLFILLIFFIGGISFLVYYGKVKDAKKIPPYNPDTVEPENGAEKADAASGTDTAETVKPDGTADSETDSAAEAENAAEMPKEKD